jgi:hypothetical protein
MRDAHGVMSTDDAGRLAFGEERWAAMGDAMRVAAVGA